LPLAILLIAEDQPGHLVLGASLLEMQLRFARAAGAGHAVVFAERVSQPLLDSIERLRRDGLSVDLARSAGDTAEMIHPDERVLLVKADMLIAPERLREIAGRADPVLLCVRDEPVNGRLERIDATARWTGWGAIDGGLLRRTTAMVGDWDLGSTVMRRAVQEGAARLVLTPDEALRDLIAVSDPADAILAGRRLVAATDPVSAGWATRWLLGPAARKLAQLSGEVGIEARWITVGAFVLSALSIVSALAGWIVASLILLLLGQLADLTGDVAARATAAARPWDKYRFPMRAAAGAIVLIAMGTTLFMRSGQWGCAVLAVVTLAASWLAAPLERDDRRFSMWRADPGGLALLGLAGFAFGSPIGALLVAATHAFASLVFAVRASGRRLASS